MHRRRLQTLSAIVVTTALAALVLAPSALGFDGGEGTWGETNDKVVTNFGFAVIAFFPLLVFVLSMIQWRLDKRRDARKAAKKRRASSADWSGGW